MTVLTMPVGPLGTNCYLLITEGKRCGIIDPGAQAEKIIRQIGDLGLEPAFILLTHGHHDHIGAVKKLMIAFPEFTLHVGREDLEMLDDPQKSLALFRRPDEAEFILSGAQPVESGDTFTLDELVITALETPGHTRGGMVYLCADALFSGDTLFREDVGRTDLYGGDFEALKASLRVLAEIKGDYTVYPGHGESTTLEHERRTNPYMNGKAF